MRTAPEFSGAAPEIKREFGSDSSLEGTGFEPLVPPRKRRPSREAPRPTIVVSRDYLCLMTPSSLSVRHLRNSRETFHKSGTDGSNPVPSSGESGELGSRSMRRRPGPSGKWRLDADICHPTVRLSGDVRPGALVQHFRDRASRSSVEGDTLGASPAQGKTPG